MTWRAGLPRPRRPLVQPRPRPAADPPAPHGLRAVPGAAIARRRKRAWADRGRAPRAGPPTTGSSRTRSSSAGSTSDSSCDAARRSGPEPIPAIVAGAVLSAPACEPCATGSCSRRRPRGPSSGSACRSTARSTATSTVARPAGSARPWRSAATRMPAARGSATRASNYPEFDLCAPLERPGHVRRRHLRAGDRARRRPVRPPREPARPLRARRPRRRLDAVPHPGARAAGGCTTTGASRRAGCARCSSAPASRSTTVGSWGNRRCVTGNFDRWPAYRRWHSLRDEPDLPGPGLGLRPQPRA